MCNYSILNTDIKFHFNYLKILHFFMGLSV